MQHVLKNVWLIWIPLKARLSSTRTFRTFRKSNLHTFKPQKTQTIPCTYEDLHAFHMSRSFLTSPFLGSLLTSLHASPKNVTSK